MPNPETKQAIVLSAISTFIAGLCCFSPLVLFFIGLASASAAGSLADTLYGEWKWAFRSAGLLFLIIAYALWYRKRAQSCPLNERMRLRRRMLNLFLLSTLLLGIAYLIWLYGIVEWLGIINGIWEAPTWWPL